jgi:hypothetical protein
MSQYYEGRTTLKEHKRVSFYSLPDFNDYYSELESRTNQIEYLNSQNND